MHSAGRILLVLLYALYWGGLTFYTGIVVRIIHSILNDPMQGGLITQKVTLVLQLLGILTVVLMIWNDVVVTRKSRSFGIILIALTVVLGGALLGLVLTHFQLDAVIDEDAMVITDRISFDAAHRRYNQFTTVQWVSALAYLPVTMIAWRKLDSRINEK